MSEVATLHVFHSNIPSMQVVTTQGKALVFVNGMYYAKEEEEIQFLNQMAKQNRGVYTNKDMLTIREDERDPMKVLEARMRAKIMAELQEQLDLQNDRGTTPGAPTLKAASTVDSAPIAAGGDATALQEQVRKLIPGPVTK